MRLMALLVAAGLLAVMEQDTHIKWRSWMAEIYQKFYDYPD
jgi:hypothetical protein